MSTFGMGATGTLKTNLIPEECHFKTEKQLKATGRGSSDCLVRDDGALSVTKWYDKQSVFIASNEFGMRPKSTCKRLFKQEKKHRHLVLR